MTKPQMSLSRRHLLAGATRKRLFDMLSTDRIPFAGYHMPFPALGFIEKFDGPSYRYIPVSYQFNV
jgi:hypothetical protein